MQDAEKNLELVSALADGQLRGESFARAVEWVSETEDARLTWHAYHIVGDVLRSGEAVSVERDVAFMQRLKLGLRQELPSVPQDIAIDLIASHAIPAGTRGLNDLNERAANESSYRWKLLAGLASLAMVSMIGWQALGGWRDQSGAAQLAQVQSVKPVVTLQPLAAHNEPQLMIRDPQLDALMVAHRQFGGTSALQMPAGFLRNATFEGAAR